MSLVKAIIAICLLSSVMYAAFPAEAVTIEESGFGYSDEDRAVMDVFYSVQTKQEPITFYIDEQKAAQIAKLYGGGQ